MSAARYTQGGMVPIEPAGPGVPAELRGPVAPKEQYAELRNLCTKSQRCKSEDEWI